MRGKRGGGRGRGRPRGPRPPSARDLAHTPAITTFYGSEQQPIAPIFQQHTGGGAAHVGNEEQEGVASVVDLTEDASSSSNVMTSPSAQTNAVTAEKTCSVLEDFLAVYDDNDGDEETSAPPSNNCSSETQLPVSHHLLPNTGENRKQELRDVWTFDVRKGRNSREYEKIVLDDPMIDKLEAIRIRLNRRSKNTDTSFSVEDKTLFVQVLERIDGESTSSSCQTGIGGCLCCLCLATLVY